MAAPYRADQGTIIPTLFIGLGGTGSDIVDRLAARAATLPNWESQLRPLTAFLTIDTNEDDQHRLRNVGAINISDFSKAQAVDGFRRSNNSQALQWLDPTYEPRGDGKPGAGQIRVESRLSFFYHSGGIRERLRAIVADALRPNITWRQAKPRKYYVYLFATLAGGTGSGCFLQMAYLIDSVIREHEWNPRIIGNLLMSTLMTDKVKPELHRDIHANTYSALKELEHLTKLDYPQVHAEGRTSESFSFLLDDNTRVPQVVTRPPFFLGFLFDRPPHLALNDARQVIADAAFLQIFTPIIGKLAGEYDNYEKRLRELTHFPGALRNVGLGYTKNFGTFGAVALVLPGRDLLEYSALRFAAQAMRSQITFGVDPRDPADDRARALAQLAVNYADPKFLNLAEVEREREINRAFVSSVLEMARQDEVDEMTRGFWFQLVESIDDGPKSGLDPEGKPIRGESQLDTVLRKLGEDRRLLLNKVVIREDRAFVFHKEGVAQYLELVGRLKEEIRKSREIVDEGSEGLKTAAREGEPISVLKLDPIAERFLVLRLLTRLQTEALPKAEQEQAAALTQDISNSKVQDRLNELYENMARAAKERRLFNRDQAFLDARAEAQDYYRKVGIAARKTLDAEVRLRQLRALAEYLERRARQYARLANRMNGLVQDLEAEAERLRRGEIVIDPPFALRVEVFETLEEPRRRIWDRVFTALFVDEGRYLSTFDRQTLAEAIARELKPIIGADGRVTEKTVDRTVTDLERALTDLGRERLRRAVLGDAEHPGLDLRSGLELEARLILGAARRPEEGVREEEIDAYQKKKFRALDQIAGVLARVNDATSNALDDGVDPNRGRHLILGETVASNSAGSFSERLSSVLKGGGQIETTEWHDPRLAIVHDVVLPIPLYYFQPVGGEIEEAYLKVAAQERRGYSLHTDFNWEEALPNLNPRKSELTVGWSLRMLADGLVCGFVVNRKGQFHWLTGGSASAEAFKLGSSLASALYRLEKIHWDEELQRKWEKQVRVALDGMVPQRLEQARCRLHDQLEKLFHEIALRKQDGSLSREDLLDRPILGVLVATLAKDSDSGAEPRTVAYHDLTTEGA